MLNSTLVRRWAVIVGQRLTKTRGLIESRRSSVVTDELGATKSEYARQVGVPEQVGIIMSTHPVPYGHPSCSVDPVARALVAVVQRGTPFAGRISQHSGAWVVEISLARRRPSKCRCLHTQKLPKHLRRRRWNSRGD